MNFLMNINFNHEIAAQRRQVLTAAADRDRLRRWSPSRRDRRNAASARTEARVVALPNSTATATNATSATTPPAAPAAATPVAVGDVEPASARVA
jgi:hypothetical protein